MSWNIPIWDAIYFICLSIYICVSYEKKKLKNAKTEIKHRPALNKRET